MASEVTLKSQMDFVNAALAEASIAKCEATAAMA
jgi:hypothetical protein